MSFIWMPDNKNYYYINGFTLSLALNQRHKATRKWPIVHDDDINNNNHNSNNNNSRSYALRYYADHAGEAKDPEDDS